jgi:polyhydroxyalkanoate synthesis regulator phasin
MSESNKHENVDKLAHAYEQMLKRTHERIEAAQSESAPRFRDLLAKVRDHMVELGELTREEANKVSEYIERDIKDAAEYIAETGEDLRDWWRFDLELMEQRMLDMFASVADQTALNLAQWAESARLMSLYQAGEIAGPGTLVCDRCGAETRLLKPGRIPACSDCGGTLFRRRPEGEQAGSK